MNVLNRPLSDFQVPDDARGVRRIRRPGLAAALLFLTVVLPSAPIHAQSESPDAAGQASPEVESDASENPLDVGLLLEDPVQSLPPFQRLREQLQQLAADEGSPEAFNAVAEELASDGIYAAAIQVLWFASKMVSDETVSGDYAKRMKVWARAASPADKLIEEGEQLQIAGRSKEAIETYLRAIESHPFNERAHFRLADAWRRVYLEEYGDELNLAPLEIRVRLFRDAYVHYRLALEIDPLFYDARYGLSELRALFPDNHEVLMNTQPLTQQALDFRGEVLPVLEEIERGEAGAGTFTRLGEGLNILGELEYAIFAWQCALQLGAPGEEIRPRIEAIRSELESGDMPPPGGGR